MNKTESSSMLPWRFQFRLRTLLIGLTGFCILGAWFSWQVKIVRERDAGLAWLSSIGAVHWRCPEGGWAPETNWVRRLLGDNDVWLIDRKNRPFTKDERKRIKSIFPEASFKEDISLIWPSHSFHIANCVSEWINAMVLTTFLTPR